LIEKEGSSSFLKKRTKKLLRLGSEARVASEPSEKSLLLLFFRKEGLASLLALALPEMTYVKVVS
jgi:hypothetical protein